MIGYPRWVKVDNWVRTGMFDRWRRVKRIRRGKQQTTFYLEGDVPALVVQTSESMHFEDREGYAKWPPPGNR